jgi:hypothetical protein
MYAIGVEGVRPGIEVLMSVKEKGPINLARLGGWKEDKF